MTKLFSTGNIVYTRYQEEKACISFSADDAAEIGLRPAPGFVLCRDENGNPTAIYSGDVWDFNPYRLGENTLQKLNFNKIFGKKSSEIESLVEEVRWLAYCILYFSGRGLTGRLSADTFSSYYHSIRKVAVFCHKMKKDRFIGILSLREFFTNPAYLALYVKENSDNTLVLTRLRRLINRLIEAGDDVLGFRICENIDVDKRIRDHNQHLVIPTMIYLKLINHWTQLLDQVSGREADLKDFICEFKDPLYGLTTDSQRNYGARHRKDRRPNMKGAIKHYGLSDVFSGPFSFEGKRGLQTALRGIQFVAKNIIHLYTGMRNNEVLRLRIGSITTEHIASGSHSPGAKDRLVPILSTTTKFSGYRQDASWLASDEVIRGINVAECIVEGLAFVAGLDEKKISLFMNPSVLSRRYKNNPVTNFHKKQLKSMHPDILIEPNDYEELKAGDPERDFSLDHQFDVGLPWPLMSHQYRRSLSFYASNSGFVSLPSLQKQYKHMTRKMAQYYQNGFENIATIFGCYDKQIDDYVLPPDHVAFEFQTGIPINKAHQILTDVLGEGSPLFGGTGSHIEKQKQRVKSGEISLQGVRSETEASVRNGEMAYKETLLGGCTKIEPCDSFMLGEFVECVTCDGAIIKPKKLRSEIEHLEHELDGYEVGTGEYQVVEFELNKLKKFEDSKIPAEEVA